MTANSPAQEGAQGVWEVHLRARAEWEEVTMPPLLCSTSLLFLFQRLAHFLEEVLSFCFVVFLSSPSSSSSSKLLSPPPQKHSNESLCSNSRVVGGSHSTIPRCISKQGLPELRHHQYWGDDCLTSRLQVSEWEFPVHHSPWAKISP